MMKNVSFYDDKIISKVLTHRCVCGSVGADKMKAPIVAKLSFQCSDLYADAMKLLQLESIRGLWPKVTLYTL